MTHIGRLVRLPVEPFLELRPVVILSKRVEESRLEIDFAKVHPPDRQHPVVDEIRVLSSNLFEKRIDREDPIGDAKNCGLSVQSPVLGDNQVDAFRMKFVDD